MDLLSTAEKTAFDSAMQDLFATFARPFLMYVAAQKATISTSLTYSRFGQHDQNAEVTAENTANTPIVYTLTGCILYGNKQPWEYVPFGERREAQQDKIRESMGTVRIKVDASGHGLLAQAKLVNLDGFDFTMVSNARPHGLVGQPTRWTYTLQKVD